MNDEIYLKRSDYKESEKRQTWHRSLNTFLSIAVFVMGVNFIYSSVIPLYDRISGIEEKRVIDSEIAQIVADEGYQPEVYEDSLGKLTIGFGHLVSKGEDYSKITPHKAVKMLREDYELASNSVDRYYPWAEGDVRLVLINMTYQMGTGGVKKFQNTVNYLQSGEYDLAAGEMLTSTWAKQTPLRASRLAGRIMRLTTND